MLAEKCNGNENGYTNWVDITSFFLTEICSHLFFLGNVQTKSCEGQNLNQKFKISENKIPESRLSENSQTRITEIWKCNVPFNFQQK